MSLFDLLIRTCFPLEVASQGSDQKSSEQKGFDQTKSLHKSSTMPLIVVDPLKKCESEFSHSPSFSEKTESILSISTLAYNSSAKTSSSSKTLDAVPSPLNTNNIVKRRHRRETSQTDVLTREDIEVDGILSSGRFGACLLARFMKPNETSGPSVVTLNTYHKSVLSETYQQHIPDREKKLMESFDHPFIATVLGSFSDRNCLYLISPVQPGGPLSHLLQNAHDHGITDKMKTFYAACVLSVLKYAHGLDIIHRGLHPDTLLIDAQGYLKVTDWGFAKKITDRTYTLCGHVEYLCPEAIVHDAGYGKGADYWALGVLIYDMFVGRSAFSPSSQDFKYDSKFDDRVMLGTGANSTHSTGGGVDRSSKLPLGLASLGGVERTPSPGVTAPGAGPAQGIKSVAPDTLELQDHDAGTIENILTREPVYPSYMPHPTKSLIQGLCQKNITQRLGTRRGGKGIEDIQKHIFFLDVEWARLNKKLVSAPWVPPAIDSSCGDDAESVVLRTKEYARYYSNYVKRSLIKDAELCGPAYTGYNCLDWDSFV